jgi:hypothetical protein
MHELRPSSLFRISYRLQRRDHLARAVVLSRRSFARTLGMLVLACALLLLWLLLRTGSLENFVTELQRLLTPAGMPDLVPYLLPGLLLLVPASAYATLFAGLAYRRSDTAGVEITLDITADGVAAAIASRASRVAWSAITRLVETPDHLFLLLSRREALVIPRQAVGDPADYDNLVGFIRARTGLSTHR